MSKLADLLNVRNGSKADVDFRSAQLDPVTVLHMLLTLALGIAPAASLGPSRAEFARALRVHTGKPVSSADIRKLSCEFFEEEPSEAACKWQQRRGRKWVRFSTYVAVDGDGWHLIDQPYRVR